MSSGNRAFRGSIRLGQVVVPDLTSEGPPFPESVPGLGGGGPLEQDRGDRAARGPGRQQLDPLRHLTHPTQGRATPSTDQEVIRPIRPLW